MKNMKNIIIIDVDSDRNPQIKIGKPNETQKPTNQEEAKVIILNDLTCIVQAIVNVIKVADNSGYVKKEDIIAGITKHLNEMLLPESTEITDNQK